MTARCELLPETLVDWCTAAIDNRSHVGSHVAVWKRLHLFSGLCSGSDLIFYKLFFVSVSWCSMKS